jgi:hypothetical protein
MLRSSKRSKIEVVAPEEEEEEEEEEEANYVSDTEAPQSICNHMKINKTHITHNIREHAITEALQFWMLKASNLVGIFH